MSPTPKGMTWVRIVHFSNIRAEPFRAIFQNSSRRKMSIDWCDGMPGEEVKVESIDMFEGQYESKIEEELGSAHLQHIHEGFE